MTIPHGTSTFSFDVTVTAGGGTTVTNTGILDPTSPNLDPIPSNPVETEIGPALGIVKLNSPTGQVVERQHDHLHARRQQRVERHGARRRRHRPRSGRHVLRHVHDAGGDDVQPVGAASSRGTSATSPGGATVTRDASP